MPGLAESPAYTERLPQEETYSTEDEVWHGDSMLLGTRAESPFPMLRILCFLIQRLQLLHMAPSIFQIAHGLQQTTWPEA